MGHLSSDVRIRENLPGSGMVTVEFTSRCREIRIIWIVSLRQGKHSCVNTELDSLLSCWISPEDSVSQVVHSEILIVPLMLCHPMDDSGDCWWQVWSADI